MTTQDVSGIGATQDRPFDTVEQQLATATHYGAETVLFISRL